MNNKHEQIINIKWRNSQIQKGGMIMNNSSNIDNDASAMKWAKGRKKNIKQVHLVQYPKAGAEIPWFCCL